jgi:hypothetical protein
MMPMRYQKILSAAGALTGLAMGVSLTAYSSAAQQGSIGPNFSTRCYTAEASCRLRIPRRVGMPCRCRLEGVRVPGRIR